MSAEILMLQDCVSLSLDLNPIENRASAMDERVRSFLAIAESWYEAMPNLVLNDKGKHAAQWKVDLKVFGALAKKRGWDLPHNFPIGELPREGASSNTGLIETLNTSDHPNYSEELYIAIKAWTIVCADERKRPRGGWKDKIEKWVKKNYPNLSNNACQRIATMVNPQKTGGAPRTPD